jgi:hypothetical protein
LPSDDAFDVAISQVNDQRRRRRAIFWIFGGLLLGAIIAALIFSAQKVDKLEKALAQSQEQLMESQVAIADLQKQNEVRFSNENSKLPEIEEIKDVEKVEENGIREWHEVQGKSVIRSAHHDQINFSTEQKDDVANADQGQKPIEPILAMESLGAELAGRSKSVMAPLPLLMLAPDNNSEVQISSPTNTVEKITRSGLEWYLGTTSNWTTLEMKGIEESTASLTEYDQRYLGYAIRAGIIQELSNRWSVDYRFSYQHLTNKSAFMEQLIYDDGLETVDANGKTTYAMDINVLSPMNKLQKDVKFQVDNFSISDKDVFENITRISDKYNLWTLSVIPKIDLIKSDKWSVNAGLGVQSNYLLNMREDMDVKLYFESQMMKNEVIQSDPSDNVNPWSLSAIGELTLSRAMTAKSSISLTAGMHHSITPVNTPSKGVAPRTYVNAVQVGLNLNFKI